MSIKRRQVLAGSAAGAVSLASGLASPAIADNEPIKIGYLPALTGPSSSTGVGINRGIQLAVELINKDGGIKGRKIELISRDTQSDPTKAVNAVAELTQRAKVSHDLRAAQLRRGAGGDAADRARQGADAASVLGRRADRRQEVPDGLPHRADQHPGRRRRQLLRGRRAEAEESGGDQRHHRLRHGLGQHLRADAEGQGRRGRLHQPYRRGEPRPQARAAAHAERRRPGDHAVERQCRLPVAHLQHARRHGLGRADRRPDHARLRPDQGPAREARVLEQGLLEQLPAGLLRQRQAAAARAGVRRPPEERPRSSSATRCCGGWRWAGTAA